MIIVPSLLRWLARLVTALLLIVLTIYLVRAFASRDLPPLMAEHKVRFSQEFRAALEPETDWQGYLDIEQRLAREAREALFKRAVSPDVLDRHAEGSRSNPDGYAVNWNRSRLLAADNSRGAAVLIHGLSDSPYSVRATAELMQREGFTAFVPRMPGHGFAVGDLRFARWEDWMAAVRVALRAADRAREPEQPLVLVGYSNGGLLALRHALDCHGQDLPCPDGIVLLSPAIDVTPLARVARWHEVVSWTGYFAKFQWNELLPEVDPYKFTSFPKTAGREIFRAARAVKEDLLTGASRLPRVLTFQSAVDDTVSTRAVMDFYRGLQANGSELVIYDVNRNNRVLELMSKPPPDLFALVEAEHPLSFAVTIVSNRRPDSLDVDAFHYDGVGAAPVSRSTGLVWPTTLFSLSHIALPFRPDDPVYGATYSSAELNLGATAPKGERKILVLTPNYFARLRYNPFYGYQHERIVTWLEQLAQSRAGSGH